MIDCFVFLSFFGLNKQSVMNKNSLATSIKKIDFQLCELVNSLICSICQEILNKPVTTPCRHSFCSACIEKVLSTAVSSGCPLCKSPIEKTSLHGYEAKLTLSEILQELPAAFLSDVKDLRNFLNESPEDLIRASKLTQLICRENLCQKKKCSKILGPDNETESFVPVLKRTTKVIEYKSRKKKRLDELMSISQTEATSNSSTCESTELDKKLDKIEKVPALEKVKEWFRTVGDNIFHNSPASSPVDSLATKNVLKPNPDLRTENKVTDKETNNNKSSSMIRIDYIKSTSSKLSEKTPKDASDPYEFVPSQNNKFPKRKKRPSTERKKKIPSFQALQNHSKETIKRNSFLLSGRRKQEIENVEKTSAGNGRQIEEIVDEKSQPVVTASQKFSKLLAETKSNEKEKTDGGHVLFSESQLSSLRLSSGSSVSRLEMNDVFHRGNSKKRKKNDESVQSDSYSEVASLKSLSDSPTKLFSDLKDTCKKGENRFSKKMRKSNGRARSGRKNSFSDIMKLKSEDALELEKSMESYLKEMKICEKESATEEKETPNFKSTEFFGLLDELIHDDLIYRNRLGNAPVALPKKSFVKNEEKSIGIPMLDDLNENPSVGGSERAINRNESLDSFTKTDNWKPSEFSKNKEVTQMTGVIGFSTQTELPEEKILKNLIENMEKELNSVECNLNEDCREEKNCWKENSPKSSDLLKNDSSVKNVPGESSKDESVRNGKRSDDVVPFSLMGKFKRNKSVSVNFLLLGRLTPTFRRSRTSVVKLVFPIGFASCAGRQATSKRCAVGVQTLQTSPKHACCSVQKSCGLFAVCDQTFDREVSMRTSLVPKSSATIQTSQEVKASVEIQTSQEFLLGACNRTSQVENSSKECKSMQTSQVPLESVEVQTVEFPKVTSSIGNQTSQSLMNAGSVTEMRLSNKDQVNAANSDVDSADESQISEMEKSFVRKPLPPSLYGNKRKRIRAFKSKLNGNNFLKQTKMADKTLSESNSTETNSTGNLKQNNLAPLTQEIERDAMGSREPENFLEKPPTALKAAKCRKSPTFSSPSPKSNGNRPQLISIDVEKIRGEDEVGDEIDLTAPEEEIGNEMQLLRVLKNIDQDLMGVKSERRRESLDEIENLRGKGDKSEESDSDFFVEQTPPRPRYSLIEESSRQSRSRIENGRPDSASKDKRERDSDGECFIDDSAPKLASETEIGLQNNLRKKNLNDLNELKMNEKKSQGFPKGSPLPSILKPFRLPVGESNENDQNQMNANEADENRRIKREIPRRKFGFEPEKKAENVREKKKFVIVASSVKNPETITKFVKEFKMEFSMKPTKEMTHLIVGLHENEDGEMLPLCTPKLLFAMANKKWIVSESWPENCLKSKSVLPEDPFETRDAVGGSGCRRARLSEDPLLKNFHICLLGNFTRISKEELASLVSDAGGTLVSKPDDFSFSWKMRFIVADKDDLKMDANEFQRVYEKFRTVILSWDVIIMFIQSQKLSEISPYMLHSASREDLIGNGYPVDLIGEEAEEGDWKSIN